MKKMKKSLALLSLCLSVGTLFLASCSDDDGEIVREYPINGDWRFNGMKYQVDANLDPVKDSILKDIKSKNLTSEYILTLDSDKKTYLLTESSILRDSGHIDMSSVYLKFESTYLDKSILEDANISVTLSDLVLEVSATEKYNDKEVLKSIGVSNPDAVIVYQADYGFLFQRD